GAPACRSAQGPVDAGPVPPGRQPTAAGGRTPGGAGLRRPRQGTYATTRLVPAGGPNLRRRHRWLLLRTDGSAVRLGPAAGCASGTQRPSAADRCGREGRQRHLPLRGAGTAPARLAGAPAVLTHSALPLPARAPGARPGVRGIE